MTFAVNKSTSTTMSNNYLKRMLFLTALFLCSQFSSGQTLMHYWNFNNAASATTITTPTATYAGASINVIAGGTSAINYAEGTGQNFDVSNLNARNSNPAGTHLRFDNPIGGTLEFILPTNGYENVIVKFATRRSTQGAGNQVWAYSLNGTNFTNFTTITANSADPELATLDFSAISGADNNANFKLKVTFEQGAGGTGGNNRFDNFTMDGTTLGGGDTAAPTVTYAPANASTNIAVASDITIAFNEAVRLVNNDAVTNANVDALVELRLDNGTGAAVPFDATISGNVITINPASNLANNQAYFVRLLPNTLEDASDNAITAATSSTFTTIAVQTQFQAGDLAFVAYRMNASSTDDEIAFVTFVNIVPGTFLTFTDSKYTSNAQPQCPNGIIWTVGANECIPAGSVITIKTSALLASKGIVTGSNFGLSSDGDQVIVYAGTADAPNYITALTSNGWIATNTTCSGSLSMIPAGLADGTTSLNTATSPGNNAGNTVNAFYSGTQAGTPAALKASILNPANWTGIAGATPPQAWPTWNFPSALQVQSAVVLNNTTIKITFNSNLNVASASNTANYTGVANLASVAVANNIATLTFSSPFATATNYALVISNVQDAANQAMACPYTYSFSFNAALSLASTFITANENAGTLNFTINLATATTGSVDLVVKGAPFSTADANDFTLATQTLNFTAGSPLAYTIQIPIIDDNLPEQHAEYFVLSLENPVNYSITGKSQATIYIKDNDRLAPVPSEDITLHYVRSFDPSGNNASTCEIVVHDPATQRLFTTSAVAGFLDIINFSNPELPVTISSIDMNPYGGVTSVAVKNGIVAVASPNANEALNGSVVFFNTDGVFQKQVTVGALPDMITFSPDGTKVLTANEGQPNADYTVDPEGSVSVINIPGTIANLTQANVTTMLFTQFNSQEAALIASGVRKLKASSTLSQDFEPEYITISADSQKAWVALQENNAIAEINLANNTYTSIWALGTKDMSLVGNGADISDNNGEILIANWPIKSFYQPDGIANYTVSGSNYIVTANEGDEKEYTGFVERIVVGANDYMLDAVNYPQASMLKETYNAGRFRASAFSGNTDADAQMEQIYALGGRSFSIFNTDTKQIVYDSGDDFEMYTALTPSISPLFNADHEANGSKVRSRAKGPEPEGVTVATIAEKTFAFVSLERVGGVMVYDITNPNSVKFVDYKNNRRDTAYSGDHGPEGITYISAANSPDNKDYIIVANEISGTLTIFQVMTENLSAPEYEAKPKSFVLFPNPAENGIVYFNRVADIEVFDYSGKLIHKAEQALTIDTASFATGIYLVKTSEGITKKLVVK